MWSSIGSSTIRALSAIIQAFIQDPPSLPLVNPQYQQFHYNLREIVVHK